MLFRRQALQLSRSAPLFIHPARRPITSHHAFSSTARKASQSSSAYKDGISAYRAFMGPFAKVFLGAIFTYQVIYWTWLKLEMDESKLEKNEEVASLEKKAKEMAASQK